MPISRLRVRPAAREGSHGHLLVTTRTRRLPRGALNLGWLYIESAVDVQEPTVGNSDSLYSCPLPPWCPDFVRLE